MPTNWKRDRARAAMDECQQDLYEARSRLEELTERFGVSSQDVAQASDSVKELEAELEELLAEWARNTSRTYRPKYTPDWRVISQDMREAANWTCQECHAYLGGAFHRKPLHVHHISRVTSDNRSVNLRVLCAFCHSIQPDHYRIGLTKDDLAKIVRQRPSKSGSDELAAPALSLGRNQGAPQ